VLISIITPTFNAGSTLCDALESVRNQMGDDTEHLMMDACSTDKTLELSKRYPHLIVRSEPDRGIYDGMNKGAELARGEWLLFLQGDDWLPAGTVDAYRKVIAEDPSIEMICGDCEAVRNMLGKWESVWSVANPASKKLTVQNIALGEPMINARLIRKDVFQRLGGFSLKYSLASDRDFLLRCAEAGTRQAEIPSMTYRYRWHAGSSTMTEGNSMTRQLSAENLEVVRSHLLDAGRLEAGDRAGLRKLHTRLTVQAAMNALELMKPSFFRSLLEGHRVDPMWSLAFLSEFIGSLPGFLARGCRTRTQLNSGS